MEERPFRIREVEGSNPSVSTLYICVFPGFKSGDAGYRSLYLSHAKRALYHLSYTPSQTTTLLFFDGLVGHWRSHHGPIRKRSAQRSGSPTNCPIDRRNLPLLVGEKNLVRVGFEPTPPKRLRPERSALDHSATSPHTKLCCSCCSCCSFCSFCSFCSCCCAAPKRLRLQLCKSDEGGVRTHASEEIAALTQRLRPLGHLATW